MQKLFGLILGVLLSLLPLQKVTAQVTLHLTLTPPYYTPLIDPIHVAGTFNNWDPSSTASEMTQNPDGSYSFQIAGTPGQAIEYKYVRGDWSRVETQLTGAFLPNRNFTFTQGITVTDTVWNWEDQLGLHTAVGNTHILTIAFDMPQLGRTRQVWVYLPQDYYASTDSFAVLYMHDAQNLFDEVSTAFGTEWQVDEAMVAREDSGFKKLIVVGMDNGGADRIDEYSPWVNSQYGGGDGDSYMAWVVNDLKPFIDSYFRTRVTRENTGLMGSSLGGLISQYGGLQYQNVFSKIGVFSPSYWFDDSCFTHVRARGHQAPMRIYHCAGGQESSSMLPKMYAMHDSLLANGFAPTELRTVDKADGQHSEWFWAREFPAAVKWLFQDQLVGVADQSLSSPQIVPSVADASIRVMVEGKSGEVARLQLFALHGAGVMDQEIRLDEVIEIAGLPAGLYFATIELAGEIHFQKLIVR